MVLRIYFGKNNWVYKQQPLDGGYKLVRTEWFRDTFLRETSFVGEICSLRKQSTIEFATLNYEDEVRVLT